MNFYCVDENASLETGLRFVEMDGVMREFVTMKELHDAYQEVVIIGRKLRGENAALAVRRREAEHELRNCNLCAELTEVSQRRARTIRKLEQRLAFISNQGAGVPQLGAAPLAGQANAGATIYDVDHDAPSTKRTRKVDKIWIFFFFFSPFSKIFYISS